MPIIKTEVMEATKLNNYPISANSLTIAHLATGYKPFYYVEEAQLNHSRVTASFYDENEPDGPTVHLVIKTKDLTDFIDEFYGEYVNTSFSSGRVEDGRTSLQYLQDNLDTVVTEYLNSQYNGK